MKESAGRPEVEEVSLRFIKRFERMELDKTEENFELLLAKFKGEDPQQDNPEYAKRHYQERFGFMDDDEGNWEIVKNAWLAST